MQRKVDSRKHLIIGFDFGTTHTACIITGVAYTISGHKNVKGILTVDQWPGQKPGTFETAKQVPSIFAYDENDKPFWGYQVKPEMKNRCTFMKLQLDKNAPLTDYDRPALRKELQEGYFRLPESQTVATATKEYLVCVLKHVRQHLEEKLGSFLTNSTRVEFWFTKPIASGDQAQREIARLAQEAAVDAGFSEDIAKAAGFAENGAKNFFGLVEDTVAGLTANLLETNLTTDYTLQDGENIMVCDCGGGQVDIGVYSLQSQRDVLEFEQVTVAQGPKVGGAHLDRRLHSLMTKHHRQFANLGHEKAIGSAFMNDFEIHKQNFGTASRNRMKMRLVMRDEQKSRFYRPEGKVVLSDKDMMWIYQTTVEQIKECLEEQLQEAKKRNKKEVKDLAVIGGLGDSPYLKSELEKWCKGKDIRLRIPKDSWNAVARGAVAYGLGKSKITKRLTQYHYGIRCSKPFRRGIDSEDELYCKERDNSLMVRNRISWIVTMGTDIRDVGSFKSRSYTREIPLMDQSARTFTKQVYCSKLKQPPRKVSANMTSASTITCNLTGDDLSSASIWDSKSGRRFATFGWKMEVLLGGREGTVILQPRSETGAVLGSGVVNVEYAPLD